MIDKLIDEIGAAKIAEAMGESVQTICNWRTRGIPSASIIKFCRAVNWRVTPNIVNKEFYPHPNDGLPHELRCACEEKSS